VNLVSGAVLNLKSRGHTEIFAFHETVYNSTMDTLAGLLLVTVVAGTVKETVTNLDGMVDHLRANVSERSQKVLPNGSHLRKWPWGSGT